MSPRILLVNPPLTHPSGPYPAICYLAGYLDTLGIRADLADASLLLLLRLLTKEGLTRVADGIRERARASGAPLDPRVKAFLDASPWYVRTIDTAVKCLQGQDQAAIARAARKGFFPPSIDARDEWAKHAYFNVLTYESALGELSPAQRMKLLDAKAPLGFAFGAMGEIDPTIYRASVMVRDICKVVRTGLDPSFSLDEYATEIIDGAATFEPLRARLAAPATVIDTLMDAVTDELMERHRPDVLALSVPFPGNVYGALRIAMRAKAKAPALRTVMGGGWVNTELRELSDPGIFDHVDFITLDDGETPLRCLLEHLEGARPEHALLRTMVRRDGIVRRIDGASEHDVPASRSGVPTYRGLPLDRYLSYRPSFQMMPRVWGRRWNKMTLAHGCYWKKCTFCDTHLDYIGRYEPSTVDALVSRIRTLIDETGNSGFHFVDEAMPPALLGHLADRLVEEHIDISWYGNVRFDGALAKLAPKLAESGCVAITGGLEVASDRLLDLMEKGVSLTQSTRVMKAFADAGIIVHAYLIYGFPTETEQETVDALEHVRQLFALGYLHSGTWHRFTLTKWSPMAKDPSHFGMVVKPAPLRPFVNYLIEYEEPGAIDHGRFTEGLQRATGLYMAGIGLDQPVESFFPKGTCKTSLPPDFVRRSLERIEATDAAHAEDEPPRRRLEVVR